MSKGLLELEELKENGACSFAYGTITFSYLAFTQRAEIIEKELKALDVIKNKEKIIQEHLTGTDIIVVSLTKEEYELLKEVLL